MNQCVGGCGLAPEPGDIFCTGCRSAYNRDPSWITEIEPDPDRAYKESIEDHDYGEDPDEWYDRMRDERMGI